MDSEFPEERSRETERHTHMYSAQVPKPHFL